VLPLLKRIALSFTTECHVSMSACHRFGRAWQTFQGSCILAGFFDYHVCKFGEQFVNSLGLGVTLEVLTRNMSMELLGIQYQKVGTVPYRAPRYSSSAPATPSDWRGRGRHPLPCGASHGFVLT
jgi:hypothetical protein